MDTTGAATPPPVSALRLRLGVLLILLWWVPFWALSPYIADALGSEGGQPSVAAVTTAVVAVQTVKGTSKKAALASIWHILIRGSVRTAPLGGAAPL